MPEFLELAHLVDQDRMAEMEIRRSRIESGLDTHGYPVAQPLAQFLFDQNFLRPARNFRHLVRDRIHHKRPR